MNNIVNSSTVGNVDQNADCVITVSPAESGINIKLESLVKNQFKQDIEATIYDELNKFDIQSANVEVVDRGAIDPVLRARLECAIKRGLGV